MCLQSALQALLKALNPKPSLALPQKPRTKSLVKALSRDVQLAPNPISIYSLGPNRVQHDTDKDSISLRIKGLLR